ncbi:hypothetical protein BpHYR1_000861 [Brachionus plicatilis]|uniref:Uncharacterized protein n=1 Tax=Brachionus plicatilis TaxID=10195 RepID=A0A3M7S3M0_BRAPC|nr:hypothetical protein BpHYR1_000861 [Brachionus plicatilis]
MSYTYLILNKYKKIAEFNRVFREKRVTKKLINTLIRKIRNCVCELLLLCFVNTDNFFELEWLEKIKSSVIHLLNDLVGSIVRKYDVLLNFFQQKQLGFIKFVLAENFAEKILDSNISKDFNLIVDFLESVLKKMIDRFLNPLMEYSINFSKKIKKSEDALSEKDRIN